MQFYVFNLTVNYPFFMNGETSQQNEKPALAIAKSSTLMTIW